jgi:hypothetical protein
MLTLQIAETRLPLTYSWGSSSKASNSMLQSPFAFPPLAPPLLTYSGSNHSNISSYIDVSPPFASNTHRIHPQTPYEEPHISPVTTFFGGSGVFDAISGARLSPLSLLLKILDSPTNPETADRRDIIHGDKSTRVGDLLDTICLESRGLQHL